MHVEVASVFSNRHVDSVRVLPHVALFVFWLRRKDSFCSPRGDAVDSAHFGEHNFIARDRKPNTNANINRKRLVRLTKPRSEQFGTFKPSAGLRQTATPF